MIKVNDIQIIPTMFPDNTSQIWKLPSLSKDVNIVWEYSNEAEFMHLAQLKQLLDVNNHRISLLIKYLPYARQDKQVSNDATFALRTFAFLLNQLNFSNILIEDPHSTIAIDLIKNSKAVYPIEQLKTVMELTNSDYVCYPDDGARMKYSDIYPYVYSFGEKVRDQLTGNIIEYRLYDSPLDKKILIVDDICDGGMTFKLLANELLMAGAKEVNLFVTHGIFSKGIDTIKESGIKKIFTKDGEVEEYKKQITYRRL